MILTELHTGGKFEGDNYKTSGDVTGGRARRERLRRTFPSLTCARFAWTGRCR